MQKQTKITRNCTKTLTFLLLSSIFLTICAPQTKATQLGQITSLTQSNNQFIIKTKDGATTNVCFYTPDIFRIWVGPNGKLTDPASRESTPIVVYKGKPIKVLLTDTKDYYTLTSTQCILRIYKSPCRFALYNTKGKILFEEATPITYDEPKTVIIKPKKKKKAKKNAKPAKPKIIHKIVSYQTLKRNKDDYFYGCGMQNGHFCHNDKEVQIASTASWNENGHPNAVPFYMSLRGYGAFRNTYAKGVYDFKNPVKTEHDENRFDCYYFYGPSLKKIINGYTLITGRPFLPPEWALEFGDADRYKDGTYECVSYADKYIDHDMPIGWFLPNDGYHLDFHRFPEVSKELTKRNIHTGMWTDEGRDFPKIVKDWGVRLFKLDIAWVGRGYKFSLDACRRCYNYIQDNSNARGILWVTLGWAGSQRYTIVWTGDNSGSLNWIRWHIPTVTGAGLSAQNGATGDVEGIFGGDKITYVRDLQWKCFTPYMMIIDHWSNHRKKPFSYGEPYTSYNRKALKLKSRLMPYLYTYCMIAHTTGVPVQRALVYEFPKDKNTWVETVNGKDAKAKYEFMSGQYFLIAPVYKDTKTWSFYLPKGKWTDFANGKVYDVKDANGQMVTNYDVSNFKLPVLVREGAIIPMYDASYYANRKEIRPRKNLQVDIYPSPRKPSSFTMFEDDGLTYAFKRNRFDKTKFTCDAVSNPAIIKVTVKGCVQGDGYDSMPYMRNYTLTVHCSKPTSVFWKSDAGITSPMGQVSDIKGLNQNAEGWYYSPDKGGVLYVKIKPQTYYAGFEVDIVK